MARAMALVDTEARTVHVRRRCPRCRHFAMHLAVLASHEITCHGGCGHTWQGRLTAEESGAVDMDAEDFDRLAFIERGSGKFVCHGRGRMTLADARRLERLGHVRIQRPEKRLVPGGSRPEYPNRSWSAEITQSGRDVLESWRAANRYAR